MAFQTIIEFVAHGLEGMGIVVVGVGGLVAYDWLLDRDVPPPPILSRKRPWPRPRSDSRDRRGRQLRPTWTRA